MSSTTISITTLYWLLVFAGIGCRDVLFNCSIRFLRTDWWQKQVLEHHLHPQRPAYNEVFFAFSVQHALAHLAFTVTGVLCLIQPPKATPSATFIQALFFHHFLWDVSIFIRDGKKYFSPKFQSFYRTHHVMTLAIGIVWVFVGVFDILPGLHGTYVLTFLGSAFTSSMSFFLRMFLPKDKPMFCILDMMLSITQRLWRWIVVILYIFKVISIAPMEHDELLRRVVVIFLSAFFMEGFDTYIHTKNILLMWRKYHQYYDRDGNIDDNSQDSERDENENTSNDEYDEENQRKPTNFAGMDSSSWRS